MKTSEQVGKLNAAMAKMQAALDVAKKDAANPYFKSKYCDLTGVWDVLRKPLTDNGLSVVQCPDEVDGKLMLVTRISCEDQWLESCMPVTIPDSKKTDPQAVGSAITYARRYAISAICGVVADIDDDAEAAVDRKPAVPTQKPTPKPQQKPVVPMPVPTPPYNATATTGAEDVPF